MKKIILFDIDHTLLDTRKLKSLFDAEILKLLKFNRQQLAVINQAFFKMIKNPIRFSPQKYVNYLGKNYSGIFPKKELSEIFSQRSDVFRQSLFSETIGVLKRLQQRRYRLGVFSEGDYRFQSSKLALSGLGDFLEPHLIFIYSNKSGKAGELVKNLGSFTVVDDNSSHILELSLFKSIFPVWVQRGPTPVCKLSPGTKTIKSLEELFGVLAGENRKFNF